MSSKKIQSAPVHPNKNNSRLKTGLVLVCLLALPVLLRQQPACAVEHRILENGLEVFCEENHLVPLVHVRITFRAGALVETRQLNGLCHLYEHMLFKGNRKYRTQEAFMAALNRLGAGSWNGGTSTEYVTYYITIPSHYLDRGLGFWAGAVREPLLEPGELSREKKVVHNEIAGKQSQPGYALRQAQLKALYPQYWYRRDVGGELAVIDNATVEQMRFIKNNYYVPNNAALFVGGDVEPARVFELAEHSFGGWEPGPGCDDIPAHGGPERDRVVVVPNAPSRGIAHVEVLFRGPDTATDVESTYGADVWTQMVNDPGGRFKKNIHEAVPGLFGGTRYIHAGYFTQRYGGRSAFSFRASVQSNEGLRETLRALWIAVHREIAAMADEGYFSGAERARAKREIYNQDILSRETPGELISNLSFWWASTSAGYYLSYLEHIQAVEEKDVRDYVKAYLKGRPAVFSIWINSRDNEQTGLSKHPEQIIKTP